MCLQIAIYTPLHGYLVLLDYNHKVLATEREPEGLGEMMKRVLHEVQLAVP